MFKNQILTLTSSKNDGDMKKSEILNQFLEKHSLKNFNLKAMKQIHSDIVRICLDEIETYECDALITTNPNHILMVYTADCIPMVFFDEKNRVLAVAHAGRNGVFLNISSKVIKQMKKTFNTNCEDILIYIGASISQECYEVSKELAQIAVKNFGKEIEKNRKIDLKQITLNQLKALGIKTSNIIINNECTKCNPEKYFSYRYNSTEKRFATFAKIL